MSGIALHLAGVSLSLTELTIDAAIDESVSIAGTLSPCGTLSAEVSDDCLEIARVIIYCDGASGATFTHILLQLVFGFKHLLGMLTKVQLGDPQTCFLAHDMMFLSFLRRLLDTACTRGIVDLDGLLSHR